LDNINVREFFSDVLLKHSINKTLPYSIYSGKKKNTTFEKIEEDCDIFDNETSIKIIFGKNPYKILEFLKMFNIKQMNYFIEFLELIENIESIKVKDFWSFFINTYFQPKKYDKPNFDYPSLELISPTQENFTKKDETFIDKLITGISKFIGGDREYNLSKPLIINRDKNLSSLNTFVILNKNAYKLKDSFNNNPPQPHLGGSGGYLDSFLESTSNFLNYVPKTVANHLGVYEQDEEGRRPFRFFSDGLFPFLNEISENKTYSNFVSREIGKATNQISSNLQKIKTHIRLNALIIYTVNRIIEDFRWTNIKNSFYDIFFGKQTQNYLKMIYNIFKSPEVRSLTLADIALNTPKMRRIKHTTMLMYHVYVQNSNLKKTNVIRYSNIFHYIPYTSDIFKDIENNENNENIENYKPKNSTKFMNLPYYEGR
jgi:hypothetical protein